LQESAVNSENGGPLKLAALCGRIARVVQRPALFSNGRIYRLRLPLLSKMEVIMHTSDVAFRQITLALLNTVNTSLYYNIPMAILGG